MNILGLFPSFEEISGIQASGRVAWRAIVESGPHRTRLISYGRHAGREVVNPPECGLAADPDDPAELAHALTRLLTPGAEWDGWSRQARARYEAQFTERHFAERLLADLERDQPIPGAA